MAKQKHRARGQHRLTATEVRALKPGWHGDGGGLYAVIGAAGAASWVYRYAGKSIGLGPLAVISLAEARDLAHDCRVQRAKGLDPKAARDADRAAVAVAAAKAMTFDQCAAAYIKAFAPSWRNPKHRQQWTNTLATYASPVIGALPVGAIDLALVLQILEPIWATKSETASRLRGRIEVILDWAKGRGLRAGENPARWKGVLDSQLPKRSKVRRVVHRPALRYAELPGFMQALRARDGIAARALEFVILTATRTGDVIGGGRDDAPPMLWSHVDLSPIGGNVWTIPKTKSRAEFKVPLSDAALALLAQMQASAPGDTVPSNRSYGIVFPSIDARQPLSNGALLAVLDRMGRGDVTVHGFRSTFRDWTAERTNFAGEVAEMALGHAVASETEAAYRRGDLFEKRRRLMQAWADFANGANAGGEVVALREGAG
jgi:integrase